jgi:hypothetical protein
LPKGRSRLPSGQAVSPKNSKSRQEKMEGIHSFLPM